MQDMPAARSNDRGGYPRSSGDDEITIETLVSWVEDAEETTDDARKSAERDRDYYDHKQLTAEERATLRRRRQPDTVINRIKPKIDYLLGYEASTRTDPRGMPRNPTDEGAAEACTDALRYIGDNADINSKISTVWEQMLIEGFGGLELTVDPSDDGDAEIGIQLWDWDRLFYDPHSRKLDFSDAAFMGGYVWMDLDDALAEYPEGKEVIEGTVSEQGRDGFSSTYEDRPRWKTWVSGKRRKRIRVVQMYYRKGYDWHYCVFVKGGKLAGHPVPFKDKDGRSFCPLLLQSAYVDRENNRYGLVRSMIDVQDEINKRRSKALHLIMMDRTQAEAGAVDDVDAMKAELAKPDGHVVTNPGYELRQLDSTGDIAGNLNLLQEAKNEIELMGPNAAMLGKDGDAPSGRAIQMNQQSGQTEISLLSDRFRHLKRRVYMHMWDLVRQYKTAEWWVRVTDDEDNVEFVGMNRPITYRDEAMKEIESRKLPPEQAQQMIMALEQQYGPALDQVARIENNPTEMVMDIVLTEVPDVANVRQEQFNGLIELARAGVVLPPKAYIKMSSLPNKTEILDEMDKGAEDENPEVAAAKKEAYEIEKRKAITEVEKMMAEVAKVQAETARIQAETSGRAVTTEIDINEALREASNPVPDRVVEIQ